MNQKSFEKACLHEDYRQKFINSLDLEESRKYIKKVRYNQIKNEDDAFMITHTPRLNIYFSIPHLRSKITVLQNSFNKTSHKTIDDFLSTLIDHEGFHARENFENKNLFKLSNLIIIHKESQSKICFEIEKMKNKLQSEIRTLENQIKNFHKRNVSNEYAFMIFGIKQERKYQLNYIQLYEEIGKIDMLFEKLKGMKL